MTPRQLLLVSAVSLACLACGARAAGLYVSGADKDCSNVSGWSQIEDIASVPAPNTASGQALQSLTVSFGQACDGEAAVLRGCLHYGQ